MTLSKSANYDVIPSTSEIRFVTLCSPFLSCRVALTKVAILDNVSVDDYEWDKYRSESKKASECFVRNAFNIEVEVPTMARGLVTL
ncbi:hypothetical protein Trydic_g22914 [Trypoxylus dichotomus]